MQIRPTLALAGFILGGAAGWSLRGALVTDDTPTVGPLDRVVEAPATHEAAPGPMTELVPTAEATGPRARTSVAEASPTTTPATEGADARFSRSERVRLDRPARRTSRFISDRSHGRLAG